MNTVARRGCVVLGVAAAMGTAAYANAGCTDFKLSHTADTWLNGGAAGLLPSVLTTSAGHLEFVGAHEEASIVGMWRVKLISEGNFDTPAGIPDDTVLDDGIVTWHSDGTEIMNSSRPPTTQSFCMGVWKQVGRSTYRLRHLTLSWFDDSHAGGPGPEGPGEIHETVTVDRTGNHYTGHFTIDQYETGAPGTEESGTPLHLTGDVSADRVTVD